MSEESVFRGIIGHQAVKDVLTQAIASPKHGYLLVGRDGSGSHLLAEAFVRALIQLPPNRTFASHPDLVCLAHERGEDGARVSKKCIPVDVVREARMRMSGRPTAAPRMVMYVPDAESLNDEGVNALLKVVEEPPAGAVFVFVCRATSRIPATLLSRLIRIELGRVRDEEIRAWLAGQGIAPGGIDQAIAIADGCPGRAWRYAHEPEERARIESAREVVRQLCEARDLGSLFAAVAEDAAACDSAEDPVLEWQKTLQLWETILRRSWHVPAKRAQAIGQAFLLANRSLGGPVTPRIWLELGLAQAIEDRMMFPSLVPSPYPVEM
jgi:DNA polymerase-3 subunit delta'